MSPPLTITGPWLALVERAGGVTSLARALEVSRSTLHHWIAGDVLPSPIVQRAVNTWATQQRPRLDPPFLEGDAELAAVPGVSG